MRVTRLLVIDTREPSRYRWMCPSFGTRWKDDKGTTFPPTSRRSTVIDAGSPAITSPGLGDRNDSRADDEGRSNDGFAPRNNGRAVPASAHADATTTSPIAVARRRASG